MVISAFSAGDRPATAGLRASAKARSGRPSARSQSAITGRYSCEPFIRFAARSSDSGSAYSPAPDAASRQRPGALAGRARGPTACLPHHRDAGGPRPSRQRVLVGRLRILLDQHPGGHQRTRDPSSQLLGKAPQLLSHRPVEFLAGDRLVEWRAVVAGLLGGAVTALTWPIVATLPRVRATV